MVLQGVAAWCCSMLQRVVACCSVTCSRRRIGRAEECGTVRFALQCVAVRCSVLQCVAVCCSVLQCVAACCSVLQHVAKSPVLGATMSAPYPQATMHHSPRSTVFFFLYLNCCTTCCSVLQDIAVCCRGLHRHTHKYTHTHTHAQSMYVLEYFRSMS